MRILVSFLEADQCYVQVHEIRIRSVRSVFIDISAKDERIFCDICQLKVGDDVPVNITPAVIKDLLCRLLADIDLGDTDRRSVVDITVRSIESIVNA